MFDIPGDDAFDTASEKLRQELIRAHCRVVFPRGHRVILERQVLEEPLYLLLCSLVPMGLASHNRQTLKGVCVVSETLGSEERVFEAPRNVAPKLPKHMERVRLDATHVYHDATLIRNA